MKVLHIVPGVGKAVFGLGPPVLNLAGVQCQLGMDPAIWTVETPPELQWASESSGFPLDRLRGFPRKGPMEISFSPQFWSAMRSQAAASSDIVHQHGIWPLLSAYVNSWRKATRKPYVIAPQGSLSRYSFTTSVVKKKFAWTAYQRKNVLNAACIHTLGDLEANEAREAGYQGPLALIPNGISDRWLSSVGDGERFRKKHGLPEGKRIALYLSRITPKKGLPFLAEAMGGLRKELKDWLFLIIGMDEFGHTAELRTLTARYEVSHLIRFMDSIFDQEKRDAFAATDLFLLPSRSEGAPTVVLEALGARVPVITTRGAPWEDLVIHRCGWWTEISSTGIESALKEAIAMDRSQLKTMGECGYSLVRDKYSWAESGKRSLHLYEWLLGRGQQPDFVKLN